jgi:hypothetical protein
MLESLLDFKTRYSAEYENLAFHASLDCDCRHNCDCSPSYFLVGSRIETDLEYDYRGFKEKEYTEKSKNRDLKELKRLKKIYESKLK